MRAGRLRHSVNIETSTDTLTSNGSVSQSWAASVEGVFAEIIQLSGREGLIARQTKADATHKITMRYTGSLTAKDRIAWTVGATTKYFYPLEPPSNEMQIGRDMEFLARESPTGV